MSDSIQSKIARGATWMLAFRLLDRALAFISTIILARVLLPADFGLVAMATAVIALIELLSAFSLEVGLIQRTDPQRGHYDTTWTLRLALAALVALVTAALALPAATFYEDQRIAPLLFVLAANILLGGFENVGVVDFRRSLNFRREFAFMMAKRAFGMPVTLVLAIAFQTYWALVIGVLAGTLGSLAMSYVMHPYRPRFCLEKWRELMSFSAWLFLFNMLCFVQARLSHFVLGRSHGPAAVGIFSVATDLAALASNEITAPINRAVLPGLSRLGERAEGVREGLLAVTAAVLLVTLPAGAGLAAIAHPLVLTLLGDNWTGAVPVVQWLAVAGAMQSVTANNHSAYLASARTHVPVVIVSTYVAVLVPAMLLLLPQGALGVALAHVAGTAVTMLVSVGMLRRYIGTSLASLWRVTWRPLVAAMAMGALVHGLDGYLVAAQVGAVARLVAGVGSGVLIYAALALALWTLSGRPAGVERLLYERLRAGLRSPSRSGT